MLFVLRAEATVPGTAQLGFGAVAQGCGARLVVGQGIYIQLGVGTEQNREGPVFGAGLGHNYPASIASHRLEDSGVNYLAALGHTLWTINMMMEQATELCSKASELSDEKEVQS